jgi:hypothetical protein
MSKGNLPKSMAYGQYSSDATETPSKFLHEIGPGFTPVITSHGDINFFEKSFEKAMASDGSELLNSKLPPLKGVPALNSKLKLNSIQLISPPSDSSSISGINTTTEFGQKRRRSAEQIFTGGPHLTPESLPDIKMVPTGRSRVAVGVAPIYQRPVAMSNQAPLMPILETPYQIPGPFEPSMVLPLGPKMGVPMVHSMSTAVLEPSNHPVWAASIQQAKASTLEKQLRFQEKNRIAAMKSRQRKKLEWERLQESERALLEENRSLKERIAVLEGEIRVLRENSQTRHQ